MTGAFPQPAFEISGFSNSDQASIRRTRAGRSADEIVRIVEAYSVGLPNRLGFAQVNPASRIKISTNSWTPSAPDQGSRSAQLPAMYTPGMNTGGYMQRQVDQFMGQLGSLLERYEGVYVAFEDGQVLATGETIRQVLTQVNAQRGEVRPILVRRVQREYPPIEM